MPPKELVEAQEVLLDGASLNGGADASAVQQPTTRYLRRWYMLLIYSSLACLQGWQWSVPGGIGTSLEGIYGINDFTIQLLINYGPIFYIPFVFPFMLWLNARDGLRGVTVFGLFLVAAGAMCRIAANSSSQLSIGLLHVGYILNSIAGPAAMGCVSTIAENWFPANERGLATAIAAEANQLGSALSFAIGPFMVPDASVSQNRVYNIFFGALVVATFVLAIAYYPSRPPRPPSNSAAAATHHDISLRGIGASVLLLARNRNFVVVALTYGLCNGMMSSWGSTFILNLKAINVGQTAAGWISFAAVVAGNVGGLLVGHVADRFRNHRLLVLCALYASALCFAWFALVVQGVLPAAAETGATALAQVAIAATTGGFFLNSIIPLMYELAVESTYPHVPEGTTIMVLTTLNNVGSMLLMFVPISSAATLFNWLFVGTVAVMAVVMTVLFNDEATRWKVDAPGGKLAPEHDAAGLADALIGDGDGEHLLLPEVAAAHPH